MIELDRARLHLEALGLNEAAGVLESRLETASKLNRTYADFLGDLLDAEVRVRRDRYLKARTRLAHLSFHKSLQDFDFSFQPSIDERQVRELATLAFVQQRVTHAMSPPPHHGRQMVHSTEKRKKHPPPRPWQ